MKVLLHIATCCIFGWAAEGDSLNSEDDFSVLLATYGSKGVGPGEPGSIVLSLSLSHHSLALSI